MRFSIQHGLTARNVRLSAPCVAGHAPKLTINGTAFTVATVRIVGKPETITRTDVCTCGSESQIGRAGLLLPYPHFCRGREAHSPHTARTARQVFSSLLEEDA